MLFRDFRTISGQLVFLVWDDTITANPPAMLQSPWVCISLLVYNNFARWKNLRYLVGLIKNKAFSPSKHHFSKNVKVLFE